MLATVGLTACATELVPMPAPTPTYTSTWEEPAATVIAPLSGRITDAATLAHPSIAAKVDNHWDARPQAGLEAADIVFEELVEGGLTRYVAIWHSTIPAEIGPVRSIRPMDPDIASPFGGIIAYSGGQPRFIALMRAAPVYNAIHGQADTESTFFRAPGRKGPHDVLVRAPEVVSQHAELAPPTQQFGYSLDVASATATKEGAPTARMDFRFGGSATPAWVWDATSATWQRFMTGGAPDMAGNGTQLAATNIVTVRVPVTVSQGIPKTELIGGGEAWVSTGGATVHATWSKPSATSPIRLVDDNGATVRLGPGNTWVELVPLTGAAVFS